MEYRVEVGLGLQGALEQLVAASVADAKSLFPNQAHAIERMAQATHRRWLEYASGKRELPDGRKIHSVTGTYLASIKIEEDGALRYVIYSDDPKAEWIEEGFPSFDMKKMLHTSDRARIGKNGKRYMVIPFRQHTESAALGVIMPQEAQAWWLTPHRRSSVVSGHFLEGSVNSGAAVTRNTYSWGDRLSRADVEQIGLDPDSQLGGRLVGMVRMQNNEDKGGQYMTFRVMTEDSAGWIMPERAGSFPAKAAYDWIQSKYEEIMRVALEEDVKALGGSVS